MNKKRIVILDTNALLWQFRSNVDIERELVSKMTFLLLFMVTYH